MYMGEADIFGGCVEGVGWCVMCVGRVCQGCT